jgi:zinc protease
MKQFKLDLLLTLIFIFSFIPFIKSQDIPVDKDVTIGTLNNGIKYYIKKNKKPEKRAELRLVVNAGSVLENEDQRGLAHFVEHMGFNGSKHFSKNDLVNYLESIGVKFGPDLNAYTSFDQTVYMLQVPTDKSEILSKAFLVLEDWAHNLSFDSTEIDKERGVIGEEWRLGRGAQMRMLDKQLPILFKNSRYAERLTIGDKHIIDTAHYETLRKFYHDWYRPDLMAVVAVGDFNKDSILVLIKEHFDSITQPKDIRKRELYPIAKHKETLFAIASDKEAVYSTVAVYLKKDREEYKTENDYKKKITQDLFEGMFNQRLNELTQLPDPPFAYCYAGQGRFIRTADINIMAAMVKDGGVDRGLESLVREAERVRMYGFTSAELERIKSILLSNLEKQLSEKDKTESSQMIDEFVGNYLDNSPIPSIEDQYSLLKKYLPLITLEEINKYSGELLVKDNRVIMVNVPEKPGVKIPDEKELAAVLENVSSEKIIPYVDNASVQPLVKNVPAAGTIVQSSKIASFGLTKWELSNGVTVILKPTDFKNDEIMLSAFKPGGSSLVPDNDYLSASNSVNLVGESGVGEFNETQLQKYKMGKIVSLSPYIDHYEEGVYGYSTPKDAETLFQLIYEYFTAPRLDSASFKSSISKLTAELQNRANDPQSAFGDTLRNTVCNYHFRMRPLTLKMIDEIDMNKALSIYKNRFADAQGFTFLLIGNLDTNKIKQLVLSYLGGLPSLNRNEKWVDLKFTNPEKTVEKTVRKGIEPKSQVRISYMGDFNWSRRNEYLMQSLMSVLDIRMREIIREEKGGSYGVGVWCDIYRIPSPRYSINIDFGCDPKRADELTKAAFSIIDSTKIFGTSTETLAKVKEIQKREHEVNVKTNSYWSQTLNNYFRNSDDLAEISNYPKWVEDLSMSDIKEFCNKYFKKDYVKITLLPEEK